MAQRNFRSTSACLAYTCPQCKDVQHVTLEHNTCVLEWTIPSCIIRVGIFHHPIIYHNYQQYHIHVRFYLDSLSSLTQSEFFSFECLTDHAWRWKLFNLLVLCRFFIKRQRAKRNATASLTLAQKRISSTQILLLSLHRPFTENWNTALSQNLTPIPLFPNRKLKISTASNRAKSRESAPSLFQL